ncbi:unnamed protein product [Acanthoscelides obtectus]|uniref:PiggyBac transposable element-derived protein domain-containing protein n=1 Tax=Acanthoscelides obtectus TaxID=200917 RepID=A0A9P0JPN4_ACAOB|nr:unnamed protein product [Acanthoscelides obtectus]CAK1641427.1 hypothetical protein AOBTE_LOCUS12396 [Acanthoscelides obtectus]
MNRRILSQAELETIAERFGDTDSEDETPATIREEVDDLSDGPNDHSDHDTESEIEHSSEAEEEFDQELTSGNCYYGRNRYKWSKTPPAPSRVRHNNIIHLPGTRGPALKNKPNTPLDAWSLLFTQNIIDLIVEHTNQKVTDLSVSYGDTASFVNHVDETELKAFVGLMLLWGVFKSGHEDVASLFAMTVLAEIYFGQP